VLDASHDAWIKYYRQDENSPNALVSYYLKGSLVALCLDLLIRQKTRGRKSLDDLMRLLWTQYGQMGKGIEEDGVERAAAQIAGGSLKGFFDLALRSTEELPLKRLLAEVGIALNLRAAVNANDKGGSPAPVHIARAVLGARISDDAAGVKLTHVLDGGAAQKGGLSAGDVIIAIDGLRVTRGNLEKRLHAKPIGERVNAHFFRRDELFSTELPLMGAAIDTCHLSLEGRDAAARRRRLKWIG
jgi:predicted metalloprotease with PDZ domain